MVRPLSEGRRIGRHRPAFRVTRTLGTGTGDGEPRLEGVGADTYPGLTGAPRSIELRGREQSFGNPAGAAPPAVSGLPGLGSSGGLSQLSSLGLHVSLDFPGQYAAFESAPVRGDLQITGSPTATVHVKSTGEDAVLFAKVYDVGPGGERQVLPSQLVTPLRVEDAEAGKDVTITLPAIDHEVRDGHRLRLVLSATDLGYASRRPRRRTRCPSPAPEGADRPRRHRPGGPAPGVGLVGAARRCRRRRGPAADGPPAHGRPAARPGPRRGPAPDHRPDQAVRQVRRPVRGPRPVLPGGAGPGAGPARTQRRRQDHDPAHADGPDHPDGGEIRVFGHAITPGAPVLSRVGAFVEGAGFLPHLSGRENLELYWRATGRPPEDAHLDEALEIAGLGDALARAVRTYSQGMRQRLAIAQAMLGLPDLLILDEPTNGLDPPQIREMREVMIRYAAAGRTVIVSSHLLAEVEQTCTHLVVMDHGRLVQAGPVREIVGSGDTLLVGTAEPVDAPVAEKVAALPGVASAVRTDDGLLVRLDPDGTPRRLIAELVRLDVPVESVGPTTGSKTPSSP